MIAAGCGRVAFDPHGDAGSAGSADAARDAAPPCTWTAFSAPARLPGPIQSAIDDWLPTPTDGGLEMFMHTYRAGTLAEIWAASRPATNVDFGAASQVSELTTGTSQQFDPTLTGDALRIIYADNMGNTFHLYEATRASPTGTFGAAVELANVNSGTAALDWNPFVSADGLRLVFTSQRAGNSIDQIYESTRPSLAAAFAAPTRHDELAVAGHNQWTPTLSADGLDIFYASDQTGGPGNYDVYTAHRPALASPFGPASLVPELSSSGDDIGMRLTSDSTTIYFNYNAITAGGGNADLYVATRACL